MIVCLIFRTAIIINRKNLIVTIKLHFENLSIFFKKVVLVPPSIVRFCLLFKDPHPPLLLNKGTFWMSPNVASLSLFYRYYFARCSSELAQLVSLPFSKGRSTHYSDRLHDFYVTISRCYKDVYVNSFFPHTARLWNSLPIKCFPLTYDLSGLKYRIDRHLVGTF